jgi:ATP-dependent DNA ligase
VAGLRVENAILDGEICCLDDEGRSQFYNQNMQQFPAIRFAVPTRIPAPFDDRDWIFELKHDGFRSLALIADSAVKLLYRLFFLEIRSQR